MDLHYTCDRDNNDGFIYVASRNPLYYELGLLSAQSLKDCYPDANITLFTHKQFVDSRIEGIFDKVYTEIPVHSRAKMWCMARTPYTRTIYIDCDSQIRHKDIRTMHTLLDGYDMFFCSNLTYTVGNIKWAYIDIERKHNPIYHGSLCGYWNTPLNLDFMQTWFDDYVKQVSTPWPHSKTNYKEWQQFDMFTLWRMTSNLYQEYERFNNLNIHMIPRRWNTTPQDLPEDRNGRPVITQIDRGFWRKLPVWPEIERRISDEKYQVKKRSFTDPIVDYS